jgi:hypothetical protein
MITQRWVIGERIAGTAGPMPFNVALPEEVPTGRIDPLLIAHATEVALFPVRGDLSQGCQIRCRIAVLQELLHADRCEGRNR